MAKKNYGIDDGRACCILNTAHKVLQYAREERMRVTRALAGSRYSRNASYKKIYVNLLSLYKKIVRRNLISQNPRVMLSTYDTTQTASVSAAEMWMNQQLIRQNFAANMGRLVDDGLMGPMGIAKISIANPSEAAMAGWNLKAGDALLSRVDLDDWVWDWRARDPDEISFAGHRRRVPLNTVKDNPDYNKKAREKIQAMRDMTFNRDGDERIGQVWRDDDYFEDLEDMCEVWEIYYPRHKIVRTYSDEAAGDGPGSAWDSIQRKTRFGDDYCLEEKQWIGHERGPYVYFGYDTVPGNLMPKGPMQDLVDLAEDYNAMYRKLMRQAARLKVLGLCRRDNEEDGVAVNKASDGDSVPIGDPNSWKEAVLGGPNQALYQFSREVLERFMEQAGNLATMGGLASQAGTLGQEELLQQQSNGQIAAMQDQTAASVSDCCDRMLWLYWHNPILVTEAMNNDPNLPDVKTMRRTFPANHPDPRVNRRVGNKPDLKIDPYSMRHTTPQQRAKDLMSIVTGIYVPLAGIAQQQGVGFDFNSFLGIMAKYMDAPDILTILSVQTPPQGQGDSPPTGQSAGAAGGPMRPPQTERTYTRKSAGANSPAANNMRTNNGLAAAMAGSSGSNGNGQGSQMQ